MLQKMGAEMSFDDTADMDLCIAALREHGLTVKILDRVDGYELPTIRIRAQITTEDLFLDWVSKIVEPFVETLDWPDDDPQQASA